MLKGCHKGVVQYHGLVVTRAACLSLFEEALILGDRVVQLRVGIRELSEEKRRSKNQIRHAGTTPTPNHETRFDPKIQEQQKLTSRPAANNSKRSVS